MRCCGWGEVFDLEVEAVVGPLPFWSGFSLRNTLAPSLNAFNLALGVFLAVFADEGLISPRISRKLRQKEGVTGLR